MGRIIPNKTQMTGYTLIAIILTLITLDNMWGNWCRTKLRQDERKNKKDE